MGRGKSVGVNRLLLQVGFVIVPVSMMFLEANHLQLSPIKPLSLDLLISVSLSSL